MERYTVIEKREAETPLQALERLRCERSELADQKMAYAGRLDPMASGALPVLVGEECKRQEQYHGLDKQYCFEVLLGFSSDTGDTLGLPEHGPVPEALTRADVDAAARAMVGQLTMPYPLYSAKPVDGKPLFQYAQEGRADAVERPLLASRVYRCRCTAVRSVPTGELIDTIQHRLSRLDVSENTARGGNHFRRDEAIREWDTYRCIDASSVPIATCEATVSSGTYIRSLAPLIAERFGTVGLAYAIHRTRVGRYQPLPGGWGFWRRTIARAA